MNVDIMVLRNEEMTIDGITLLSIEEYNKYKENIPSSTGCWWLRSPGYNSDDRATVVNTDGSVDYLGEDVDYSIYRVRPVLKISNHNLKVKNRLEFKNYLWTVISENLAICDTFIGRYCFRKNRVGENANDYNTSDIKKYIEDWLYN